ncbi:MAG: hypothetical protein LDLANPLL_01643 [Turneriella sp.]|nr:hypothetical protein [Turneriella sp.]
MGIITFREDIQGLRAIAVLSVGIFHFNKEWLPGGFVGVDIFLVISGFLITSILLQKKNEINYRLIDTLKYFYFSRFKRIVPAYMVLLVFSAIIAGVLFIPQDFDVFSAGFDKAFYFNSNQYFSNFGDYFAPSSYEQPLLHTWSLAVEIQFYIIAPFLVLLVPKRLLLRILIVLSIVLLLIAEYRLSVQGAKQATYYSLYARLPEFFMGAIAALLLFNDHALRQNKLLQWSGLVAVIASVVFQPELGNFPGLRVLLPTLGATLILLSQPASQPASQSLASYFLTNKFMVWMGALSYSFYLWHWPVLAFLRYYTGMEQLDLYYSIYFVLITIALTLISYYLVELPFRKKKFSKLHLAGAVSLLIVIVSISFEKKKINTSFTAKPLPIEFTRYADDSQICHGKIVGDCLQGDLKSQREILVLGDSHAAMLNHFFDYLGKELKFKVRIITASSCVTIPGFDYERIAEWAHKPCLSQIEEAKKYLSKTPYVFLAASWNWQLESPKFKQVLHKFLLSRDIDGKKIYLLEQEPLLNINPQRALRAKFLGLSPVIGTDKRYLVANAWLRQEARAFRNVQTLNFGALQFFSNAPFYGKDLIYMDEHHLNQVGAVLYAKVAQNTFKQIVTSK